MNIAMLSYHTCPLATLGGKDTGGMNVYVAELTRSLGQLGIHVDVFTRSQDEHVPHVLHNLGYCNRVVHIPAGPEFPMPKPELVKYIPRFAQGIAAFAEEKGMKYDLVHSHYWMSGIGAIELKKKWNTPILQMFHTLVLLKNKIARTAEEREGQYRIDGEMQVIAEADGIIASTVAEEKQLVSLYQADPEKIKVIPPGVDTSRFYPIPKDEARDVLGFPKDKNLVLFVGRIEPLKGLDTLIHALAYLRNEKDLSCCPHYLVIIGGDPNATEDKMNAELARNIQLCEDLHLDDIVLFLGKRGQEFLPYYYSAADLLVMPSHYESFGMVALEAMACGTPVIASHVGGLVHLVKDDETGLIVPNGDPRALGDALAKLLLDDDYRQKLGRSAIKHARKYSWDRISSEMIDVYESMLKVKTAA
ncbi:MAG TPA: glycosyltransferase [Bellilinea sp.]|nr:glycosyltransferase [Bellilinea sp.]